METYETPLFRPPAEANSLIAQLTIGCPNNRCRFCAMYSMKRYRVRAADEFIRHGDELQRYYPSDIERAFLADGDSLMADTNDILSAMSIIRDRFPSVRRFASYASALSIKNKNDDDLCALKNAGMRVLYLGIESGDAETLARMNKNSSPREMITQAKRVMNAGLRLSVTLIVGLGGRSRSHEHARASAAVVNDIAPTYTNMLALMHDGIDLLRENDFAAYTPDDHRRELREFIAGVNCTTIFRANHASNYIPLEGRLPRDREMLLAGLNNG
ncbi:MAG: radical SAM protein [Spirochaetes bacterium]|nr:radical SAM protein [Spirochaetota bacterium]